MHVDAAAMRPVLSRQVALRGPKFYRDGANVMFVNHLDASTREGPREATTADAEAHPKAFEAFVGDGGAEPFRPLLAFSDPPSGKPPRERGPHEQRRAAAQERGETA